MGNGLAVVTDKKLASNSTTDYYPFGKHVPGRISFDPANEYRYGFTGHEKETEITNSANHYSTEYRLLDTRLGRWPSVDPLFREYPSWSSYNYVMNNPLQYTDPDGKGPTDIQIYK